MVLLKFYWVSCMAWLGMLKPPLLFESLLGLLDSCFFVCLVLLMLLSLLLAGDEPETTGVMAYGDEEFLPFEGERDGDFEELPLLPNFWRVLLSPLLAMPEE